MNCHTRGVLFLACLALPACPRDSGGPPSLRPFTLDPAELDFGEAAVGSTVSRIVAARNSGTVEVRITEIAFDTQSKFSAEPRSFRLAAGASQQIVVRYSPLDVGADVEQALLFQESGSYLVLKLRGAGVRKPCTDECAPGTRQCIGGGYQICGPSGSGCLRFGHPTACPSSATCKDGECVSNCTNQCTAGSSRCAGQDAGAASEIQTCGDWNSDGCTEWSAPKPCGDAGVCSGGACKAGCTDQCKLGTSRCSSSDGGVTSYQLCSDWNMDGCTEWGASAPCGDAGPCQDGGTCAAPPGCAIAVTCYCCTPGKACFGSANAECAAIASGTGGAGYMWLEGGQNPVSFCVTSTFDRFKTASGSTVVHFASCNPQSGQCACQTKTSCTKTASWSGC